MPSGDSNQLDGNSEKSYHADPIFRSRLSWSEAIFADSQNPVSLLLATGFISLCGSVAPHKPKTLVRADVPLRCIPNTSKAQRVLLLFPDLRSEEAEGGVERGIGRTTLLDALNSGAETANQLITTDAT